MASALSWISAAVRHSSYSSVSYSSTSISVLKSHAKRPSISIHLEQLRLFQNEGSCWHPLLPHSVIAKGFPIRERAVGKGLEISFADMALLSQSMSFNESGGGLVAEGLRTLLIPMKTLEHDDAIQWHLEYKRHPKLPNKRSVSDILANQSFSSWYKTDDLCELTERRCFLGWAEEIAVVMGTAEYSNTEICCSEALPAPKTRNVKIKSISMEASGFGIFRANGSNSWHPTSVPSKITLELDKDIYDTLADEYLTRLMIYDTEDRISWLLPQSSVILYVIYKIITRRRYRLFDGDREVDFIFANPVANGGKEADSILRTLLRLKVQKSHDLQECLSKTVRQVLLLLDQLRDGLKSASAGFEPTGPFAKVRLYGVEFNDMMEMRNSLDIKQAQVDQPWTQIARDGTVVLFGSGISQPIISMSPYMCATYMRVPPSRDLMATTGSVLNSILHHHHRRAKGTRLGDEIEWIKEDTLFQSHIRGETVTVFHEQRLRVVKQAQLDPSIYERIRHHASSGFIFTDYRSRRACSEAIASADPAASFCIKKTSSVCTDTTLSDVPEDDFSSVASSENDFGVNNERLPTSSISSDESPPLEADCKQLGAIIARTSDAATELQMPMCLVEASSRKQISTSSTPMSNTPRAIKRNKGCTNLATLVGTSENKPFDECVPNPAGKDGAGRSNS